MVKESKDEKVRTSLAHLKVKQKELDALLEKPFSRKDHINKVFKLSEAIQQEYAELIIDFQEYSFKHDFESVLWKCAYHKIISKFRFGYL